MPSLRSSYTVSKYPNLHKDTFVETSVYSNKVSLSTTMAARSEILDGLPGSMLVNIYAN